MLPGPLSRVGRSVATFALYFVGVTALGVFWYALVGVYPRPLLGVPLQAITLGEAAYLGSCAYLLTKMPWG